MKYIMKKSAFILFSVLIFAGCSQEITLTVTTDPVPAEIEFRGNILTTPADITLLEDTFSIKCEHPHFMSETFEFFKADFKNGSVLNINLNPYPQQVIFLFKLNKPGILMDYSVKLMIDDTMVEDFGDVIFLTPGVHTLKFSHKLFKSLDEEFTVPYGTANGFFEKEVNLDYKRIITDESELIYQLSLKDEEYADLVSYWPKRIDFLPAEFLELSYEYITKSFKYLDKKFIKTVDHKNTALGNIFYENAVQQGDLEMLHFAIQIGADLQSRSWYGDLNDHPLVYSIEHGNAGIFKQLLKYGTVITAENYEEKYSIGEWIILKAYNVSYLEIMLDKDYGQLTYAGKMMDAALENKNITVLALLLEKGISPDVEIIKVAAGFSAVEEHTYPLIAAAEYGFIEGFSMLLKNDALTDIKKSFISKEDSSIIETKSLKTICNDKEEFNSLLFGN